MAKHFQKNIDLHGSELKKVSFEKKATLPVSGFSGQILEYIGDDSGDGMGPGLYKYSGTEWKRFSFGELSEFIKDTEVNVSPDTNGQTVFNITPLPKFPNLADLFINGTRYPYGQCYTFMTSGELTWLNNFFKLNTNMQLTLKYQKQ